MADETETTPAPIMSMEEMRAAVAAEDARLRAEEADEQKKADDAVRALVADPAFTAARQLFTATNKVAPKNTEVQHTVTMMDRLKQFYGA